MSIKSYRDLIVWQKAMVLVNEIYTSTRHFPEEEKFGLVSQMRRSAVSIPSNIAEGFSRNSRADYVRFLRIAHGSGSELDTQLEIAKMQNFLADDGYFRVGSLLTEVQKMLNSLIKKL